jgi:hypothetical protein
MATPVKPIKALLEAADALIGHSADAREKVASESHSDIDQLADRLLGATDAVDVSNKPAQPEGSFTEVEKTAMALNRIQCASYLDAMSKVAAFEKKAKSEGYTQEQIDEALSKTAAKSKLLSLPQFTAVTEMAKKAPSDLNMPKKVPQDKNVLSKRLGRIPLTKSLGY